MYINEYVESMGNAWAETTKRSELHRLNAVKDVLDGDPERLWNKLEYMKPYSRLTTWTRVTQYWDWLMGERKTNETQNPYKLWRKKNARVFKNAYTRQKPEISFKEAEDRIKTIEDEDIRTLALQILHSGMRTAEVGSYKDGERDVVGKGGRRRRIYLHSSEGRVNDSVRYWQLRRALAKVGLKPHDLRKIFLSRLVELGANEFELCEVAGWSSITTASSYIKVSKNRLEELVKRI
jgi:hypothetical protein